MWKCGCCACDVLCDDDTNDVKCGEIVSKGNARTQCKRPGIHYDEFHGKYYCKKHFKMNEYLERKFPLGARHSRSKRISFKHKFDMDNDGFRESRRHSLESVSGSSEYE